MSTRSSIAIKRKDGTVQSVYCHSDGYLEYNGVMLNKFYKDQKKINSLINLGDLSFLDRKVNPEKGITHSFDYEKRQEGVTVAYVRDRNDKNTQKHIHKSVDDYIKSFANSWQEYAYLYDEENHKWLWSEIPIDNKDGMNFIPLEDTLNKKGLMERVDKKFNDIIWQQIEFEKGFDIGTYNEVYESDEDAYYDYQTLLSTPKGIKGHIEALKGYIDDMENDNTEFVKTVPKKFIKIAKNNIKSLEKYAKEVYPYFDEVEFPEI